MQRFAVFDIDGTVIRWQLYHAIVDALGAEGHLDPARHRAIQAARHTWKSRSHSTSFDEYEQTLVDVYHEALTNLKVADYMQAVDTVFEKYKDQVYTYSRDLIRTLKEQDYLLFIISGSQQEIIQKLGDYYGFDEVIGTRYTQKDGHFTGAFQAVYGHKAEMLQQLMDKHRVSRTGSIAIGDSNSDIPMLELVEHPIAFNPTKELLAHAQSKQWDIVVERKNVVYELKATDGSYVLA